MIVKVKYYKGHGFYSVSGEVKEYAYETDLPLEVGDKVIAPTQSEPRQRAIVSQIRAKKPGFPLKRITEYDPEGEVTTV